MLPPPVRSNDRPYGDSNKFLAFLQDIAQREPPKLTELLEKYCPEIDAPIISTIVNSLNELIDMNSPKVAEILMHGYTENTYMYSKINSMLREKNH